MTVERDGDTLVGRCGGVVVRATIDASGTAGATAAGTGPTRGDPDQWLPGPARAAVAAGLPADADLALARALVAVSWTVADSGLRVVGQAQIVD